MYVCDGNENSAKNNNQEPEEMQDENLDEEQENRRRYRLGVGMAKGWPQEQEQK